MYEYNTEFYQYINRGSENSASVVVPAVLSALPVKIDNVLDVGCGAGAWLSVWKRQGCNITGIDGDYVDRTMLMIDESEFTPGDLTGNFQPGRRFDLAQSLEVAEHLPEAAAASFVDGLCASADIVLFSAAAPGQGGENHINEQPYEYWQGHFERNGYSMYDAIRDGIIDNTDVMPWYRYNSFVYVKRGTQQAVHDALAQCLVAQGQSAGDKSPKVYQLRKWLIRIMPVSVRTRIAVLKKKIQIGLQRPVGSS